MLLYIRHVPGDSCGGFANEDRIGLYKADIAVPSGTRSEGLTGASKLSPQMKRYLYVLLLASHPSFNTPKSKRKWAFPTFIPAPKNLPSIKFGKHNPVRITDGQYSGSLLLADAF